MAYYIQDFSQNFSWSQHGTNDRLMTNKDEC